MSPKKWKISRALGVAGRDTFRTPSGRRLSVPRNGSLFATLSDEDVEALKQFGAVVSAVERKPEVPVPIAKTTERRTEKERPKAKTAKK